MKIFLNLLTFVISVSFAIFFGRLLGSIYDILALVGLFFGGFIGYFISSQRVRDNYKIFRKSEALIKEKRLKNIK